MANHEGKNDQDNMINAKDFLIGALIGAVAGAATALFLAPKSGKEIRSDLTHQAHTLKEKTIHLKDVAVTKGNEMKEVAKEKTQSITQAVSKQSNELISKVKNLKSSAEEVLDELEDVVEDVVEEVVDAVKEQDVQKKLEETKKAFDETELLLNQ